MGFGRKKSSSDDSSSGLRGDLGAFVERASAHTRARAELFSIEAKEAIEVYGRKFYLTILGSLCLTIGYCLFLAGAIGSLAAVLTGSSFSLQNWTGAALCMAFLHLMIGIILIKRSKRFGKNTAIFEYTRNEFKKDQQWTKQQKRP